MNATARSTLALIVSGLMLYPVASAGHDEPEIADGERDVAIRSFGAVDTTVGAPEIDLTAVWLDYAETTFAVTLGVTDIDHRAFPGGQRAVYAFSFTNEVCPRSAILRGLYDDEPFWTGSHWLSYINCTKEDWSTVFANATHTVDSERNTLTLSIPREFAPTPIEGGGASTLLKSHHVSVLNNVGFRDQAPESAEVAPGLDDTVWELLR